MEQLLVPALGIQVSFPHSCFSTIRSQQSSRSSLLEMPPVRPPLASVPELRKFTTSAALPHLAQARASELSSDLLFHPPGSSGSNFFLYF